MSSPRKRGPRNKCGVTEKEIHQEIRLRGMTAESNTGKLIEPMTQPTQQLCPCSSGKDYIECCYRFISGEHLPTTPEELMRSRYTAFTQADMKYIEQTMQSPASDHFDPEKEKAAAIHIKWINLEVIRSFFKDEKGFVEFKAHFIENDAEQILHELSEFHFENKRWYYIDGQIPNVPAASAKEARRNDPCPCGSGKKYKKCCGT